MVQDLYESLIEEVGKKLKVPDFKPNAQNTSVIELPNGLQISFLFDSTSNYFVIGAKVAKLLPGRFRYDVLLEALKSNGHPSFSRDGIFGYNHVKDELYIFKLIPSKSLDADKIVNHYFPLKEKAHLWFESLKRGEIPSATASGKPVSGSGMFGLR